MGAAPLHIMDSLMEGTNFDREELDRMRKRFMKLDKDLSGTIDKEEFLLIPGVLQNPLAPRLIEVFDDDGLGLIDFQEFIEGLSVFSGRSDMLLKLRFVFKIYDMDRDGYILNGELFLVLQMMVGSHLTPEQLQQLVDRAIMENDQDGDGRLSFDEFKAAVDLQSIAKSLTLHSL